MKLWTPWIVSTVLGLGVIPALATAQERMPDTTERKEPLKVWGAQFEEFEYRYSDDDEEIGVWDADFFYGTDNFKARWITKGEYSIEEQAYETLENQLVGQIPISKFFDAKAGVRFDAPEGNDRHYAVLRVHRQLPTDRETPINTYLTQTE